MEGLKKSFLVRGNSIVGFSDKNFSTLHVGCVIPFAGNTDNIPYGYLLADGASYPTTEYPDLYAVIGNTYGGDSTNFNVPDYRETVLVGVGENTTDIIADHDVYELGEFKDDQLQNHTHAISNALKPGNTQYIDGGSKYATYLTSTDNANSGRIGTTTHGKQKGVTYIIKAFHTNEGVDSGVSDDVIEYVDNKFSSVDIKTTVTIPAGQYLKVALGENKLSTVLLSMKTTIGTGYTTFLISNYGIGTDARCRVQQLQGERKFAKYIDGCNLYITPSVTDQVWYASAIAVQGVNPVLSASETYSGTEITTNSVPKEIVDGLISDTTSSTVSTWSSSMIASQIITATPSYGTPSDSINKNVDNMTKSGFYTIGDGNAWTNLPVATYGILKVFNCGTYIEQQFTVLGGGTTRMFVRTSTNTGTSWVAWKECTLA